MLILGQSDTGFDMAFLVSAVLQSAAHSQCLSVLLLPLDSGSWLSWLDTADAAANPVLLKVEGENTPPATVLPCVLHVGCSQAVPHISSGSIKKTGTLHRTPTCHAVKLSPEATRIVSYREINRNPCAEKQSSG